MTKEEAIGRGYCEKVHASGGDYELELLVKPNADLDGTFPAFDLDAGELLNINGWLFSIERDAEELAGFRRMAAERAAAVEWLEALRDPNSEGPEL